MAGQLASEKDRLRKVLTDGRIRLGMVVSDLHTASHQVAHRFDAHPDALSGERNALALLQSLLAVDLIGAARHLIGPVFVA